jgi:hypothetical protein
MGCSSQPSKAVRNESSKPMRYADTATYGVKTPAAEHLNCHPKAERSDER